VIALERLLDTMHELRQRGIPCEEMQTHWSSSSIGAGTSVETRGDTFISDTATISHKQWAERRNRPDDLSISPTLEQIKKTSLSSDTHGSSCGRPSFFLFFLPPTHEAEVDPCDVRAVSLDAKIASYHATNSFDLLFQHTSASI
jgi:hypothetical protein